MPIITVCSRKNPDDTLKLLEVNGRRFPCTLDEDTIAHIPGLKLRDDDVMICGYMGAGTHWCFELINMLLAGVIETVPARKESLHLEQASQEMIDTFQSPRVLNSHLLFEELPREVIERKTKIVYLVRDPRDSLTSWYICNTIIWKSEDPVEYMSFPDWLELINNGELSWDSWFENMRSWENALRTHPDHPIHVVHYEELRQNTVQEIMKIKDFLCIERYDDFCKGIAEKTPQLERMRIDKDKYTQKFGGEGVHYNKGTIGNWKTMFTVSMSEEFDQLYERKMSGSRFRDRYSGSGT